jgi:pimeloyl-ACP methyl ester carboxylesterase
MAMPRLMQRASVDGAELAYSERGAGEPIVLVHGGIVADAFVPLLEESALAGRHRLVAYHRRGYGQSARAAEPASIARQAADCLELMRHLGIARAHVAGYSFGGTVALQLARDAPEAVQSLALLEPTIPTAITDPTALESFLGTIGSAFAQYGAGDKAGAVDTWARGAFGPDYRAALDRALPEAFAQAVADADALFQIEAPALQEWAFGPEDAARVTQPVLSIYHEDPVWVGFQQTHALLRSWFPRLETFVLPGTTHLLQMAHPREAAEGLAGFFARHPLTAPA